jgi:ferredoxin
MDAIVIDPGRCQGHGICLDRYPSVFESDDNGYAQVGPLASDDPAAAAQARKAAALCPEGAISVHEAG